MSEYYVYGWQDIDSGEMIYIGLLKTICIGNWTLPSERMTVGKLGMLLEISLHNKKISIYIQKKQP